MTIIQRVILVIASTLIGCQSQVGVVDSERLPSSADIIISATNIGNITEKTPFNIQIIRKAFPGYDVTQKMHSTEAEMYPVILVSRNDETLLTINPATNQALIHSVIVESPKITPYSGYSIGMSYQKIQKDIIPNHCTPGQEELSGTVICIAKSAPNISYIFTGHWQGPDGELPPLSILNSWQLSKLVWWVTNIKSPKVNTGVNPNEY